MIKIFKKIKNLKYKNQKKGIALVIAITVMTLLLSISFSISNIVLRQIKITNINNESKPAFYVADSGVECALYYDTTTTLDINTGIDTNKEFASAIFGATTPAAATSLIKCGLGLPLGLTKTTSSDLTKITTTFDIDYGESKCARVVVIKSDVQTWITARGYNTGVTSTGCDLTNLDTRRLVERGLTITY